MQAGSDEECDDVVFLSLDESPPKKDQGASPQLRRSSKKRKSVSVIPDMSKGSSSKKKKNSPVKTKAPVSLRDSANSNKSMPKMARTPTKAAEENIKSGEVDGGGGEGW